jgi:hypothetical protein
MSKMNTTALLVVQLVQELADVGRQVRARRKQQRLRIDDAAALAREAIDISPEML